MEIKFLILGIVFLLIPKLAFGSFREFVKNPSSPRSSGLAVGSFILGILFLVVFFYRWFKS